MYSHRLTAIFLAYGWTLAFSLGLRERTCVVGDVDFTPADSLPAANRQFFIYQSFNEEQTPFYWQFGFCNPLETTGDESSCGTTEGAFVWQWDDAGCSMTLDQVASPPQKDNDGLVFEFSNSAGDRTMRVTVLCEPGGAEGPTLEPPETVEVTQDVSGAFAFDVRFRSPSACGSSPTPEPSPTPQPSPTPDPTPSPTPDPTPSPTPDPTPSPTPQPTPAPTPSPPSPCIPERDCHGHGTCSESYTCECFSNDQQGHWGGHNCTHCETGWYTANCDVACDPTTTCSDHGSCDENGVCLCFDDANKGHWAGQSCDTCQTDVYGANCTVQCTAVVTCNGHGTCSSEGMCQCDADSVNGHWTGESCDKCATGWGGDDCGVKDCNPTVDCSGHGDCLRDGSCMCYKDPDLGFWSGAKCDQCQVNYYPSNSCVHFCQGSSTCSGHGTCTSQGQCKCDNNTAYGHFAGADCSVCGPGWYGSDCTITCNPDTKCSGHGECASDGSCSCFDDGVRGYWDGHACNRCKEGVFGKECVVLCEAQSSCSGHGTCKSSHAPDCECFGDGNMGFWAGSTCSRCQIRYHGDKCLEANTLYYVSVISLAAFTVFGIAAAVGYHKRGVSRKYYAERERLIDQRLRRLRAPGRSRYDDFEDSYA